MLSTKKAESKWRKILVHKYEWYVLFLNVIGVSHAPQQEHMNVK